MTSDGFVLDPIALPDGRVLTLKMDLSAHVVRMLVDGNSVNDVSMTDGSTGTSFGDQLLAYVGELGLNGPFDRSQFESDDARKYDVAVATAFHGAMVSVADVFGDIRGQLVGECGPVQLWPHGFDLAFEWFGKKLNPSDGNGNGDGNGDGDGNVDGDGSGVGDGDGDGEPEAPTAQINVGFYPGGDAYFYSNPHPFDLALRRHPLPHGAVWHDDGWQGSRLDLGVLAGDPDWRRKVTEYALAVHHLARPTLTD